MEMSSFFINVFLEKSLIVLSHILYLIVENKMLYRDVIEKYLSNRSFIFLEIISVRCKLFPNWEMLNHLMIKEWFPLVGNRGVSEYLFIVSSF